jgi:hypothetical protein
MELPPAILEDRVILLLTKAAQLLIFLVHLLD